jgi:histidinol-phosphatase
MDSLVRDAVDWDEHDAPGAADPDLLIALELADIAGDIALRRFRGPLHLDHKPDGSPVTDADREVEAALRAHLAAVRPDDAVLGEELGATGGDAPRRWILDPIDGTRSFIRGRGTWTTLIALERDGEVALGVVSQPAHRRRWWAARGTGAWSSEGTRLHVSSQTRLSEARLCDDNRGSARWGPEDHPAARLGLRCATCRAARDRPLHMMVAEGRADLSVQLAAPWDLAPSKVIVEEAGGRFTDVDGGDRIDTGSALASNGVLHRQALAAIRGH